MLPGIELQDVAVTPAAETIRRGSRLISDKVGIIRSLSQSVRRGLDPLPFTIGVSSTDLSAWLGLPLKLRSGAGSDTLAGAIAAAIGEAVERYCMMFFEPSAMRLASYREIAAAAVPPDELRLHSREQTGGRRRPPLEYFDETTPVRWIPGFSLTAGAPRLVPAALVYQGYRNGPGEARIGSNASTGLAAGGTLEEAILSGLYECVERDAFTLGWLWRRFGEAICIAEPQLSGFLERRFQTWHPDVDLRVFALATDHAIPAVVALLCRPAEFGPVLCIGSAARLDARSAVRKAVIEAGQSFPYLRMLHQLADAWEPAADFSNVDTFEKHVRLYVRRPELIAPALAFCGPPGESSAFSGLPCRATGSVRGDIERCVRLLDAVGCEVLVVDVTTPDVADVGFRVVRVLVTRLLPLHYDHSLPFLGVRRLWELPAQLGWTARTGASVADLNPFPHPFP